MASSGSARSSPAVRVDATEDAAPLHESPRDVAGASHNGAKLKAADTKSVQTSCATDQVPAAETAADERIRTAEAALSAYLEDYVESGPPLASHLIRHPRKSIAAIRDLLRLPVVHASVSTTAEGAAVRRALLYRPRSRAFTLGLTSTLAIPADAASYSLGAAKQTLRRKVRAAEKLGVRWAAVDDPDERRRLLDLANQQERQNSREQYRVEQPANDDLLDYALWLVASLPDDTPIMLSVTPVDGKWAALRYFRTLQDGPEGSAARYLMTSVLVERLSEAGVTHLVDAARPHWLQNGLRHFQRMVGFRLVRIRFHD